jgi:hypothetical protein
LEIITFKKNIMASKRTTHRSVAGKKLYAVRDANGRFKDIQTYERAHRADMAKNSKAEDAKAAKPAKAKPKAAAKKAAPKAAAKPAAKKAAPKKATVKKAAAKK